MSRLSTSSCIQHVYQHCQANTDEPTSAAWVMCWGGIVEAVGPGPQSLMKSATKTTLNSLLRGLYSQEGGNEDWTHDSPPGWGGRVCT